MTLHLKEPKPLVKTRDNDTKTRRVEIFSNSSVTDVTSRSAHNTARSERIQTSYGTQLCANIQKEGQKTWKVERKPKWLKEFSKRTKYVCLPPSYNFLRLDTMERRAFETTSEVFLSWWKYCFRALSWANCAFV